MGITAGIAAVAGIGVAVQANQQKIASQKQADAIADAQKAQAGLLQQQQNADAQRKAQENSVTQQAFAVAASNRKTTSAATLPGAVQDQSVGNPGPSAAQASKTLIGG